MKYQHGVIVILALLLAGACGGREGPEDPADPPELFDVLGSATGLLGPVTLELRSGGKTETLVVEGQGAFAFDTPVLDGQSYAVEFAEQDAPCTLSNQSGRVSGADVVIDLVCTGAALASIAISGIAPVIDLASGETEHVIDLPLSQSSITVTATAAFSEDEVTIADTPVPSGEPSEPFEMSLGENHLDIVVKNSFGWQRAHRLTLRRAAELVQYAYAKASNTAARNAFGGSLAVSGDTLVVGARSEDGWATGVDGDPEQSEYGEGKDSGAVYVFRRYGASWHPEAYIKASNTDAEDAFGASVAIWDDILVVGAPGEDSSARGVNGQQDDDSATNSGAVYVYRRTGTSWAQEAYLKASNARSGGGFGNSVALAGDTLAVGSHGERSGATGINGDQTDDSAPGSGAVYVFRRIGTTWQQEAYIKASNTDEGDQFGQCVALGSAAAAGDTLAVGAIRESSAATGVDGNQEDESARESGAVYVFRRHGASWTQEAYVKASNTEAYDFFGESVAITADTLAVGTGSEESAATGIDGEQADNSASASGAVYVFRHADLTWHQEAYVKAPNTDAGDYFGNSVALRGDTLMVGAPLEDSSATGLDGDKDDDGIENSGAVYLYLRNGTTWAHDTYLKPSNSRIGAGFGGSVALAGDTLAAAASAEDSAATGVNGDQHDNRADGSGAVYVFH